MALGLFKEKTLKWESTCNLIYKCFACEDINVLYNSYVFLDKVVRLCC